MSNHSPKRESLQNLLLDKLFKSEHLDFVTNRQIHHWKEIGLLEEHRKYAASGMKSSFNFYEVIWIRIITEMRSFHISNISIKQVKRFLFASEKEIAKEVLVFESTIREVILKNEVKFLVILKDKSISILDKQEYLEKINAGTIHHHFLLQLDLLVWKMLTLLNFEPKIKKVIQQYEDTKHE